MLLKYIFGLSVAFLVNYQAFAMDKEEFNESSPLVTPKTLIEIDEIEIPIEIVKKKSNFIEKKKYPDAVLLATNIGSMAVGGLLTSFIWYGYYINHKMC